MNIQKKNIVGRNLYLRYQKIDTSLFEMVSFFELNRKKYPFLLESSAKGNKSARFSIIFCDPDTRLVKNNFKDLNFLETFNKYWEDECLIQDQDILKERGIDIPFLGGWFVYLGYELIYEIEDKLNIPDSPFKFPTAFASRIKSAIILDHIKETIYFFSEESNEILDAMEKDFFLILNNGFFKKEVSNKKIELIKKGTSKDHQKDIKKCIDYIFQGEIFQANLSRLWEFKVHDKNIDSEIYRELKKTNPSPFAGMVFFNNSSIISSSPERLVSIKDSILETRPIAGTRPRGGSGILDVELSRELISSEKERAEHLMLVDLERNDISRVCKFGTVKVDEMMVIESYSHVHHIVSNIKGVIRDNVKPGHIISAVFPGGTITGCPKVRCIEILGELEKIGRGPYTGSFGYVNHNSNLDFNILIRSMLMEEGKIFIRAGGGIVADSIPEKETLETEAKVNAMLEALQNLRSKCD